MSIPVLVSALSPEKIPVKVDTDCSGGGIISIKSLMACNKRSSNYEIIH